MMRAPMSRMDILTPSEIEEVIKRSPLVPKYNQDIDRESAYEILNKKIELAQQEELKDKAKKERQAVERTSSRSSRRTNNPQGAIIKVLTSATFIRGVMSILNKAFK